jgi:hypothetical protein
MENNEKAIRSILRTIIQTKRLKNANQIMNRNSSRGEPTLHRISPAKRQKQEQAAEW